MRFVYKRRKLLTTRPFTKPSALAADRVTQDSTFGQDALSNVVGEAKSTWRKLLTWARLKRGLALVVIPVVPVTAPTLQMEQNQSSPGQTSDEPIKPTQDATTRHAAPLRVSIENTTATGEVARFFGPISSSRYSIPFGIVTPDAPYSVEENLGAVPWLELDPADELIQVLGPKFPEENTPEKHAESRQVLHEAFEELKKGSGEIGRDWAKDRVKEYVTDVALVVATSLVERGRKSGSKLLHWSGEAIIKICHHAQKPDITANEAPTTESAAPNITASQAAEKCECSVEQAEALLRYLGYRRTEVWLPPSPER